MKSLVTVREAKDYLAGVIADEADREGAPLTELERKMLYYSESGWTLPDIADVCERFDREFDPDEYEERIAGLVRAIEGRHKSGGGLERERWNCALDKLGKEDHYLTVLVTSRPPKRAGGARPSGDFTRLIFAALACSVGVLVLFWLLAR